MAPASAVLLAIAAALACAAEPPGDASFQRLKLDNGVRVIIAHIPDAPRQSTFTFLPLHLGNDGGGRAQWSHLLEHHLIRSTNGESDPMMFNGETTASAMRLDSYVVPEEWPEALGRHAAWMTARAFEAESHDRERVAIAQEQHGVAMSANTHKFALAAWNQIVRHGLTDAAVHHDVAESDLKEVQAYAALHLPLDERVLVATVGPAEPEEARQRMEEHFAPLARLAPPLPEASRVGACPGAINATWDLPVRHVIVWRRLPDEELSTQAAALAAAHAAMMSLMQNRGKSPGLGMTVIFENVPTPEGRYFVAIASVGQETDEMQIPAAIEEAITGASRSGAALAAGLARQLKDKPDFKAIRQQVPEQLRHVIEGNWLIQRVHLEYATCIPIEAFAEALGELSREDIEGFVERLLGSEGGVVVLEPRQE